MGLDLQESGRARGLTDVSAHGPFRGDSSILSDRLNVEMDADLVADEDPAGLQRLVPGEPEVAAVELRVGAEAGSLAAPGIASRALEGDVEGDRARDIA